MAVSVQELLVKPFATRNDEDRLKILVNGPQRPNLVNFANFNMKLNNQVVSGNLLEELYSTFRWLTGCEKRQRFFCWPCLLFVDELSAWNSTGYYSYNVNTLREHMKDHKKAASHVQGLLDQQLFLHRNAKAVDTLAIIQQHNQVAKRNRELMKRIIDSIYHMVLLRTPPPQKDTGERNCFKVSECVEYLKFLRSYDTPNIIDDAIELLNASPSVMTDLLKGVKELVKATIKKEIQLSTYTSVILSEHSEVDSKSQISTVLRYLKGGKVYERFVGFTSLNEYKSAEVIHKHMKNVISEYGISERFLAFAVDGAVTSSTQHLAALLKKVRMECPYSFFTPYYYHHFHHVLVQSLHRIAECHVFFQTMNSIKNYIHSNPNIWETLSQMTSGGLPNLESENCCNPDFLRILKKRRKQLVQIFDSVVENCDGWTKEDVAQALGFQYVLQDFPTVFLLEAFYKIFGYTSTLDKILSSNVPENAFGGDLMNSVTNHLTIERDLGFENLWISVIEESAGDEDTKPPALKAVIDEEYKLLWRERYLKIIDLILNEIITRFEPVQILEFFHILNCEKHGKFVISPEDIKQLVRVHGPYFDELGVKNEITVVCVNKNVFDGKSVHEVYDIFVNTNLRSTFEYLFKLSELILTTPCKIASPGSKISKLDSISQWSYIPGDTEFPGEASMLLVEKEVLEEVTKRVFYYDEVLLKFFERNKSIDVMYR